MARAIRNFPVTATNLPVTATNLLPNNQLLMDIVALAEVGLLTISTASIIFYGGRMVQKVDDLGAALNGLSKRFDEARIPDLDKRVCKLEVKMDTLERNS